MHRIIFFLPKDEVPSLIQSDSGWPGQISRSSLGAIAIEHVQHCQPSNGDAYRTSNGTQELHHEIAKSFKIHIFMFEWIAALNESLSVEVR